MPKSVSGRRWLPAAVENGADTEAREGMAVAQYIAGMMPAVGLNRSAAKRKH